jgi:hypothetical protein
MRGNGFCTDSSFVTSRDDRDDEILRQVHHVVEARVRHFRFDHPELSEVPACLRLLGAEGRTERIDASERHGRRLEVQLSALRQVRLLVVEVLDRKQRGGSLARGGGEDRRVGQDEAARVEEVADRIDDLMTDAQDRRLAFRSSGGYAAIP